LRQDEANCSAAQLSLPAADENVTAGSSTTVQPHPSRPTDFVHRTRDAGFYLIVFGICRINNVLAIALVAQDNFFAVSKFVYHDSVLTW